MPYALFIQIYFGIVACNLAFGHALMTLLNVKKLYALLNPQPSAPLMTEMSLLNSSSDEGYSGVNDTETLDDEHHSRANSFDGSNCSECDEASCGNKPDSLDQPDEISGDTPDGPQSSKV